ncbi:MAG TPA: SRPBCC family protein [Bdellovibrionales bacterium]|nr:SRPBCC family protein [Bdellovibrionales bacterium]
MVKKTVIAFVLIVAAIVGYAFIQPSEFKVERSTLMEAPPETVFPYLNNPRLGEEWNPFSKMDPEIKMSFDGPAEGVGAKSSWNGNSDVGEGAMTIVESVQNERVRLQLDFKRPMEGTNMAEYILTPADGKTQVTWKMTGQNSLIGRIVCLFLDMDKMVGGQFEKGLTSLKTIVEAKR